MVVDNEDRENEGDLIFAAELATPELVAFMVRYTSGYICAPLMPEDCARLNLPPMIAVNEDVRHTAYTVTVDAATGSTGISAGSRAETIRRLADPTSEIGDFTRPGHVVPLAARPGGVLERDGHTEASIDLARLAGLRPAGVLCEIVSEEDPTDMARSPELRRFADAHGLSMISIEQLIEWRRHHETQIVRSVSTRLPTEHGVFTAIGYTHDVDKSEHIALIAGDVEALKGAENVLVRVHSECLTGDVFGSRRCDCGPQLNASLRAVQEAGQGLWSTCVVRGSWNRLGQQAQGLSPAGQGPRHCRRQPRAGTARRRTRVLGCGPDLARPWHCFRQLDDQQSAQGRRPLWLWRRRLPAH